jgi:hypothetical protein
MCTVSMIYDHYWDKWSQPTFPWGSTGSNALPPSPPTITPEQVTEFLLLLERARKYDKEHNEPNCELREKRERVQKLAEELGVEIKFPGDEAPMDDDKK